MRRCRRPHCVGSMEGRPAQARYCTRACGKAHNAWLNAPPNRPTTKHVAPKVESAELVVELSVPPRMLWDVTFDDGVVYPILAHSEAQARTKARWARAIKDPESGVMPFD